MLLKPDTAQDRVESIENSAASEGMSASIGRYDSQIVLYSIELYFEDRRDALSRSIRYTRTDALNAVACAVLYSHAEDQGAV